MKKLIPALVLSLFAASAFADLTPTQITTLRSLAQSDPVAADYMANGNDPQLAEWFNTAGTFTTEFTGGRLYHPSALKRLLGAMIGETNGNWSADTV